MKTLIKILPLLAVLAAFACRPSEEAEAPAHAFGASRGYTAGQRLAITTATWYVGCASCGGSASDSNNCTAVATPCATFAGITDRFGPGEILVPQNTTINVQGDVADTLNLNLRIPENITYRVLGGVKSNLATGTLNAATAIAAATNVPQDVTETAGDWSTDCTGGISCVGERITLSSGKSAWIAKRTAATVARTSPFGTEAATGSWTLATPAGNETFAVERLYSIAGINIRIRPDGVRESFADLMKVQIDSLQIGSSTSPYRSPVVVDGLAIPGARITRSKILANFIQGAGSVSFDSCGWVSSTGTVSVAAPLTSVFGANLFSATGLSMGASSTASFTGSNLIQGAAFAPRGAKVFISSNGLSVFDSPTNGITSNQTDFDLISRVWGSGNSVAGWYMSGPSRVAYDPTLLPTITGGTADFMANAQQPNRTWATDLPFTLHDQAMEFVPVNTFGYGVGGSKCGIVTLVAGTKNVTTGVKITASTQIIAQYNTRAGATTGLRLSIPTASRTAGAPGTGAFTINSESVAGVVDVNDTSTVDWCAFVPAGE